MSIFRSMITKCLNCRSGLTAQNTQKRFHSATYKFLEISKVAEKSYLVELNKAPVNTLNLELLQELKSSIEMLEEKHDCSGIIFTSKFPIFSAGFDINEFFKPEIKRLREFWRAAHQLTLKLFLTSLVTASAINGSCLAAGCILAFTSDVTVMNRDDNLRIGLTATKLGIPPPFWLLQPLKNCIGHRQTEILASRSVLISPKEALNIGMIQNITSAEHLLSTTIREITKRFNAAPYNVTQYMRMQSNKDLLKEMEESFEKESDKYLMHIMDPATQTLIENHFKILKNKI